MKHHKPQPSRFTTWPRSNQSSRTRRPFTSWSATPPTLTLTWKKILGSLPLTRERFVCQISLYITFSWESILTCFSPKRTMGWTSTFQVLQILATLNPSRPPSSPPGSSSLTSPSSLPQLMLMSHLWFRKSYTWPQGRFPFPAKTSCFTRIQTEIHSWPSFECNNYYIQRQKISSLCIYLEP